MKTFHILGLLMSYPKLDWLSHLDECKALLREEQLLPKRQLQNVLAFVEKLQAADPYGLQEEYVETFDRGRSHSLHLFEHVHGDSRDRGQAMVNLADAYEAKGLFIDRAELPDYLPLFLEFLSTCSVEEAVEWLGEPIDIVGAIGARLGSRKSGYAALFDALVALSSVKPDREVVEEAAARQTHDDSLAALDREWEEAAAFAGPPRQTDCTACKVPSGGLHVKVN